LNTPYIAVALAPPKYFPFDEASLPADQCMPFFIFSNLKRSRLIKFFCADFFWAGQSEYFM